MIALSHRFLDVAILDEISHRRRSGPHPAVGQRLAQHCIHQQAQQQLNRDSGQSFLSEALLGLTPGETASALIPT
jgi:hypothetical protein